MLAGMLVEGRMRWVMIVAAMLALAGPAGAQTRFVDPSKPIYIVSESGRGRPVMASAEAMDRAQKLIAEGISRQRPDLLRELIVCTVKDGTRVSLLGRAGMFYRRIMIAEGPSVGCEGVVAIDWLTNAGQSQQRADP